MQYYGLEIMNKGENGMEKLGFIGLGIMGMPMARHLCEAGNEVWVNDVNSAACEAAQKFGARPAPVEEIGAACDVVFMILPNGGIVQQVLFESGLTRQMKPGALVVDMSSVTPEESRLCAQKLAQKQVHFLDAPVSGGEPGAVAGTLAFMAGGDPQAFERAKPYFDIMGSSALRVGSVGSGSVTKLANQIMVNLNIAAVSEALVLAAKAGADPALVYQAIRGGLAGSHVLDAKAPMMMRRDFRPGGKISINHKDIKNVMVSAHSLDVPLPLTALLFEIMQALKADGHMDEDHSAIVKFFEKLAGVTVKSGEVTG